MSNRIAEKTLILPALYIINNKPSISTSELIKDLTEVFNPAGEDAEILVGRNDTKFSQKVRNLKSHRDTNGMDKWTNYNNGRYSITPTGREYLIKNLDVVTYLFDNRFNYEDAQALVDSIDRKTKKRKIIVYDEKEMISEGELLIKETAPRKRSRRLREAAIAHYTSPDGRIVCEVCGFDFYDFYGDIGEGFIEMHHENPIYQYSDEGFEGYIQKAIENMKPLCANCHKMIHRRTKKAMTISQLKACLS